VTKRYATSDELLRLRNIGPAMAASLHLLGVDSVDELATRDADLLYLELGSITGTRPDPCVHDTFAAAIHQARTGEALPWWAFTAARKRRQAQGTFVWYPDHQRQTNESEGEVRLQSLEVLTALRDIRDTFAISPTL
jgi:hypothetical protein